MSPAACLLTLVLFTIACWIPLLYMLVPYDDHPRYVAPDVVADVPNVTFRGGIV